MSDIRIVVAGAAGRMGRTLVRLISETPGCMVSGAFEAKGHADLGKDAGVLAGLPPLGVLLTDDPLPLLAAAQAVVDFTIPKVSVELAALAAQARIVDVIGSTGFSDDENAKILAAARHAVIIKSGNFSKGVTMLAALVKQAAKALPDFDIEILEMHHNKKVDAPSGTALLLGEAAAKGREISFADHAVRSRDGHTGARVAGTIGFAALRGGTVIGDHQVIMAGTSERIVLSHLAEDRSIFAHGAISAILWGQGKKEGLYSMADVLGVS
ncbi:MAG: 4-hydroxy-tetrahydrodipicolinate reductase [Rhizomicrobium sp.]|nr:4-hydroxy-tetrahydrodipicolinate reductase [Rhizomicrobium sp.]